MQTLEKRLWMGVKTTSRIINIQREDTLIEFIIARWLQARLYIPDNNKNHVAELNQVKSESWKWGGGKKDSETLEREDTRIIDFPA